MRPPGCGWPLAEPYPPESATYRVEGTEEVADLRDAMSDKDNPTFTTGEAMEYLHSLRM